MDEFKRAELDFTREDRCGFPEVIYGESKSVESLRVIIKDFLDKDHVVLATRVSSGKATELLKDFTCLSYDAEARVLFKKSNVQSKGYGRVLVVCAGTSDLAVAKEALLTLETLGYSSELICDVGVAGVHRLIERQNDLDSADCIITIAGMEGALPSVLGGLVSCPVIACPTSVGYGASFQGLSALLGMLNSCASGLTVVNIDNGFGAACAAIRLVNKLRVVRAEASLD